MLGGIYSSASGMLAEDARADVISNNLANVNTAGFRKDYIAFRARNDAVRQFATPENSALARLAGGPLIDSTPWDRQAGPTTVTDRPYDLALRGDGFFEIQRRGKTFYTRAGNFIRDAQNRLATADGLGLVMGSAGQPIDLSRVERFEVSAGGAIEGDRASVAELRIVDFDNPAALRKTGDGLFEAGPGAGPHAASAEVAQGALEGSSVEPVREMVAMIEGFRAYERNAQMLRIQDDMLKRAVNDIGRMNG